jgi:hypothetical protein
MVAYESRTGGLDRNGSLLQPAWLLRRGHALASLLVLNDRPRAVRRLSTLHALALAVQMPVVTVSDTWAWRGREALRHSDVYRGCDRHHPR